MKSIWKSFGPALNCPFEGSSFIAFKAPMAAPHAEDVLYCPHLFILPTLPNLSTPTCGENMMTIFPLSGQWLLNAPQPVYPVNGRPPRPPNGKISPHL
jgi:hypothetical protein